MCIGRRESLFAKLTCRLLVFYQNLNILDTSADFVKQYLIEKLN